MFLVIDGLIEFVQGRTLAINGLKVDIPKEGFAYIAAELLVVNGRLVPQVREINGPSAERYGFMKIDNDRFESITDVIYRKGGGGLDFGFASPHRRPKVTMN